MPRHHCVRTTLVDARGDAIHPRVVPLFFCFLPSSVVGARFDDGAIPPSSR